MGWTLLMVSAACGGEAAPPEELGWTGHALGSFYETKTTTVVGGAEGPEAVTFAKHTLLSKSADAVELSLHIRQPDGSESEAQVKLPANTPDKAFALPPEVTVQKVSESCTVPAGTFECTKTVLELGSGPSRRSVSHWTVAGFPLPVRTVVQNEAMTSLTELVSLQRGTPR